MRSLKYSLYISLFLMIFLSPVQAMESDNAEEPPKYLSRYFTKSIIRPHSPWENIEEECCEYFPTTSIISFNSDPVYSPAYDALNGEIKKQLTFLDGPAKSSTFSVNFLTVILSATGTHEDGRKKRVYENLYVKTEGNNQVILSSKEDNAKILVLSSNDQLGYNTADFKKNFNYFSTDKEHNLFNLSSFSDHSPAKINFKEKYNGSLNNSHTEPLCFSSIKTLPFDTFTTLLPNDYNLDYYEIHFISSFDACQRCTETIYEGMTELKNKFGPNLFMFYHSNLPVKDKTYRIKSLKADDEFDVVKAAFCSKLQFGNPLGYRIEEPCLQIEGTDEEKKSLAPKELNKRKNRNYISSIPSYYFGFIYELEGKTIKIIQ